MSDSVRPHRRQPIRFPHPWDSPGKTNGVGWHFLLQCIKVKSESEVTQSCLTLRDPMDCSLPGSSVHGIFQAEYWSGLPLSLSWPKLLSIACCQRVLMNRKDDKIRALWTSHEQPVQDPSAYMHVTCWLLAMILKRYCPSDILSRTIRPRNKSLLGIPNMTSYHCYWLLKWDYYDDFREIKQDFTQFYTW